MSEIIRIDLGGVNCYLAACEDGFILFDTGGHLVREIHFTNRRERLVKALEENGCNENNLNLLVLTHGDNDHACNAAYIREKYNTKIAMHTADRNLVARPGAHGWTRDSFQYRLLVTRVAFDVLNKAITHNIKKMLDEFDSFLPDILLEDGDTLTDYGLEAKIIHTPCHTGGSIVILTGKGDLIAGDMFINIKKPERHLDGCDFSIYAGNLEKIKREKVRMVYPGHGKPFRMEELI